jgi:hypothetical protein
LAHDDILTNGFLHMKRGTLEIRIAVSREWIARRARELSAHTYEPILDLYTFSRSTNVVCYRGFKRKNGGWKGYNIVVVPNPP